MKYFKPNSKKAIKIATAIKGLTATLATFAYVNDKPNLMFVIMIIGAVANEAINFFSEAEPEKKDEPTV